MTPERFARLRAVLDARQPDLTIIADQVHKARNLAAIVRTSDAMGLMRIHSVFPEGGYQPCRGTAGGSTNWVENHRYQSVADAVEQVRRGGHQVVATVLSGQAVDYREIDYTRPTAIMVGGELAGISSEGQALADTHMQIPMVGMVQSLNVSVAAAIILTEARRQREAAGLFNQRRIPDEEYYCLLFQRSHPRVARMCEERGLPYPELDEKGLFVDPRGVSEMFRR